MHRPLFRISWPPLPLGWWQTLPSAAEPRPPPNLPARQDRKARLPCRSEVDSCSLLFPPPLPRPTQCLQVIPANQQQQDLESVVYLRGGMNVPAITTEAAIFLHEGFNSVNPLDSSPAGRCGLRGRRGHMSGCNSDCLRTANPEWAVILVHFSSTHESRLAHVCRFAGASIQTTQVSLSVFVTCT